MSTRTWIFIGLGAFVAYYWYTNKDTYNVGGGTTIGPIVSAK